MVTAAGGVNRNTYQVAGATSEGLRAPLKTDAGARNLVYISSVNTAYAITAIEHTADQDVGDGVAMSGISSSYVSGTIGAVDLLANVCGGNCYVAHLNRASYDIKPGDSGSPTISRTLPRAFGISYGHAVGDNRALYSPIDAIMADLALRLCLDAACN